MYNDGLSIYQIIGDDEGTNMVAYGDVASVLRGKHILLNSACLRCVFRKRTNKDDLIYDTFPKNSKIS